MMKYLIPLLIILSLKSAQGQNESPRFDGFYLGISAGSQNVFGGSFVNEMDVLAQQSKVVTEIPLGFRKQFYQNRFMAGVEFQLGFLNGELHHDDPSEPLSIDYQTSSQRGFGLQLGITVGRARKLLVYGYLNETKREFEVDIRQQNWRFSQTDKQGMLKYGVGVEYPVWKYFNVRGSFGSLRVDFGDLKTNINVEDKFDAMLGLIFQF